MQCKNKEKNMRILWKKIMQRYKDMGNLLLVVTCILFGTVGYYCPTVIKHVMAGGDELILGGIYTCNLLTLIILSVNLIRIDCRNLLSKRTAGLLESMGFSTLFFMIIRDQLVRNTDQISFEALNSMDWTTFMFMGMILIFVGKIVRQAVKIKEENDLTI